MRSQALIHISGLLLAAALAAPLAAEAPRFTSLEPSDGTLQKAAEVVLEGEVAGAVKLAWIPMVSEHLTSATPSAGRLGVCAPVPRVQGRPSKAGKPASGLASPSLLALRG